MYKVTNTPRTKRFLLISCRFRYGIFYILDCCRSSDGILRRKSVKFKTGHQAVQFTVATENEKPNKFSKFDIGKIFEK